ncbi:MAG: hypothetical protein QNK32_06905 [Porticoccus sp.]|nr:hypothetical protein [Porticoccus sp.]
MMTPELRNWYLSNLGIVQYQPKGEEPVSLSFQAPSSGEEASSVVCSAKEDVASILKFVDKAKNSTSQATEEPVFESKPVSVIDEVMNFRLACWQPCDDLLVFNQFPPGVNPEPEELQLLSNILRAIGRLPDGLPAPELIDWPMSHGGETDESAARSMLSVFLDARITKRGVLWVLLMGEVATKLLSPSEKTYSESVGVIEEIAGGAKIIVVRSLQEMLKAPDAKAETWQAIKSLADRT